MKLFRGLNLAIAQIDISGNPYIGIFCAVNENIGLAPFDLPKSFQEILKQTLKLDVVLTSVAGSKLIGALLALNSNGVVVNDLVETKEVSKLKEHFKVTILEERFNAIGNNILTNDNGALVHNEFTKSSMKKIEDALDVEVMDGTIAELKTVGASGAITNRGGLCHPKTKDDELEILKSLFKIDIIASTANYGTPFVGACLVANSKGVVTGTTTTGIELGRIEDGFLL